MDTRCPSHPQQKAGFLTFFPKYSYMEKTIDKKEPSSQGGRDSKLEELFFNELRELYGAEQHQLNVLPMLKKAVSSQKLSNVLANHLDDTRVQIGRLEMIFKHLGYSVEPRTSEAILGITREAEIVIEGTQPGTATRDAGIIVAAQKMEHYEITSYGSLAQHASTLDHDDIVEILESSLFEEKEMDELLTAVAENYINKEASRE
jgi:ferritin-like metal-binding protein YciE